MSSAWQNDQFGCFGDCTLCIITYLVPCYIAGNVAEQVGKNCCLWGFLTKLGCIGVYTRADVRSEIRRRKNIEVRRRRVLQTLVRNMYSSLNSDDVLLNSKQTQTNRGDESRIPVCHIRVVHREAFGPCSWILIYSILTVKHEYIPSFSRSIAFVDCCIYYGTVNPPIASARRVRILWR